MTPRQLALPLGFPPFYAADAVIAAPSNEAALAWLDRTGDWPDGRLALWGDAGVGKTHLLHRWQARQRAILLPALSLPLLPCCDGRAGGIAIDDADLADEERLLHLLNASGAARVPVLLASRAPPARWCACLPDLASRLRAITAVPIPPPEEVLLRALLTRLLAARKLVVAEPVQDWLLARLPRTAAAMREAAARLDRLAYQVQRPVSRAMAAAVLADLPGDAEPVGGDEVIASAAASGVTGAPALL
ncbi:MAG TPA: chromosomal replication initiator DnaA [Acetobacteraceae bacterium]|nr:chromosomal replication initiator DnaA [Acetobacteraceae bacterium]